MNPSTLQLQFCQISLQQNNRGSDKTVNNKKYPTNLCQEWNSECDWKSFNCIFHDCFLFSPLP